MYNRYNKYIYSMYILVHIQYSTVGTYNNIIYKHYCNLPVVYQSINQSINHVMSVGCIRMNHILLEPPPETPSHDVYVLILTSHY